MNTHFKFKYLIIEIKIEYFLGCYEYTNLRRARRHSDPGFQQVRIQVGWEPGAYTGFGSGGGGTF